MDILQCGWDNAKFLIFSQNVFDPLIYYSHLLPPIAALLVGFFVLINDYKNSNNIKLFLLCVSFSVWVYFDLILWADEKSELIMFFWNILIYVEYVIFYLALSLLYSFTRAREFNFITNLAAFALLLPIILSSHTSLNISYYDLSNCDRGLSEGILWSYLYILEVGSFVITLIASLYLYLKRRSDDKYMQHALFMIGVAIFQAIFISGNITLLLGWEWQYEQYKLFGMLAFLIVLVFLIVRFKVLNIKLLGAQALVWILIILIGSQFFFIRNNINKVLNGITFVFVAVAGTTLIRSVKKVDTQRELLERANEEQQTLMHFITHQIKGFFTKSRNIFDTISDDAEALSPNLNRLVIEGLRSDKEGIELVENILNAANLKNGKIKFTDALFDMDTTVRKVIADLDASAKNKNLAINYYCTTAPVHVKADEARIKDLVRNLIQNAILYTFKGGINISLAQNGSNIEFVVKDTGIGLTENDKARLFQSGGRGEESVKYNTSSTGYGLFIAKKVVENYNGQIWAESEGRDKGAKFTAILPIVQSLLK